MNIEKLGVKKITKQYGDNKWFTAELRNLKRDKTLSYRIVSFSGTVET